MVPTYVKMRMHETSHPDSVLSKRRNISTFQQKNLHIFIKLFGQTKKQVVSSTQHCLTQVKEVKTNHLCKEKTNMQKYQNSDP